VNTDANWGRQRPLFVIIIKRAIMNRKKRILMCAESHDVNSGFGRYTQEILQRLHNHPDYEIAEFASYRSVGGPKTCPWKVYPNAVTDDHPDSAKYKANPINQFGQWRFDKVVLHFKPDIVFDIRDYWMFSYQELCPLRKYYHWVVAPTIDSIPQKTEWLTTFENADVVLTHTEWAENYLRSLNRPINILGSVSDSVDHRTFRPVTWTKNYHKAKYGLPTDSIIIGSVMRNQKRKLIAELFSSLRQLIDQTKNNKIYLYLHTSYPEAQGWHIPELLQEYGVYNNVIFTYYCPATKKIFPSLYKGPMCLAPDNSGQTLIFPNVVNGVNNDQLCQIYNLFDIYVQYAICEGLGIPQLEAAACGIPIFAVNYSGMEEITTKVNGVKINHLLSKELETGSDRATPDNQHLVSEIIKWIQMDEEKKEEFAKNTRDLLVENYSWDKTAESFIKIFDSLEPKNIWDQPMITNPSAAVPDNLSNREFVNFIIDNIILEPSLKSTYFAQSIIRSLDETFSIGAKNALNIQRKDAVQHLEVYLNNKIFGEKARSGEILLNDDFLNE
jgi:glycosyltransferase involved in cell wall biosynthesis